MTNIFLGRSMRIFVFFLILFLFHANTVLHAQDVNLADRLDALDSRVQELENELNTLSSTTGLTDEQILYYERLKSERAALNELRSDMRDVSSSIASEEVYLSNHYFQIFLAVFTTVAVLLGALGGTFGYIAKRIMQSTVLRESEKYIEHVAKDSAKRELTLITAINYQHLSYTWWQHYEPEYQKLLRNETPERSIVPEIKLARNLAYMGLHAIDKMGIDKINNDPAFSTETALKNLVVYNWTAEILALKLDKENIDQKNINELLKVAQECEISAMDDRFKTNWFHHIDTVAFCYIKIGEKTENTALENRGHRMIRDIFDKKIPKKDFTKPPLEWLIDRYNTYFPKISEDGGEKREDLLRLGVIPYPAEEG